MEIYDAVVDRVIDGDTVEVSLKMKVLDMPTSIGNIKIRVAALWCPERYTAKGKEATEAASLLLLNKKVKLLYTGSKTFDRFVGEIIIDGVNFTVYMVENGHGSYYEYD